MASRTKQKEEARARRLAEEQARTERERRTRRTRMLSGVLIAAVVVVAVAIAVSSSGGGSGKVPAPNSAAAKAAAARVEALLAGIPQSGNTLGNPSAKVTITEYGDLECGFCDEFALAANVTSPSGFPGSGMLDQLISQYVRTGKAKLVFRSLETASSESSVQNAFLNGQTAASAAGLQNKGWDYIELFYNEQGKEGTGYATSSYLDGLARQIPGLNYSSWLANVDNSTLEAQVQSDDQAGTAVDGGSPSTPTVVATGPLGQAKPIVGLQTSISPYVSAINSVS